MKITKTFINQHRTVNGGWTRFQLDALGVSWPPEKGWQDKIIGKEIDLVKVRQFVLGKQVTRSKPLDRVSSVIIRSGSI